MSVFSKIDSPGSLRVHDWSELDVFIRSTMIFCKSYGRPIHERLKFGSVPADWT
jgi:hypothetical protein